MSDARKFLKDKTISWYRSKVDPAVLKELTQRSDWRGLRQSVGLLGLCFLTGAIAYTVFLRINTGNGFWLVPLLLAALFVHGTFCHFAGGTACHELMHRTPFKTKALNEFFLRVFAFLGWWDHVWFRPSHIKHHQATVHNDYDGEVVLPSRFTFKDWRFWARLLAWDPLDTWNLLKLYTKRATGHMDNEWYGFVIPEGDAKLRKEHRNWARLTLLGHATLAAVFITTGHWFLIILVNGRQYCHWLGFLCGHPQHYGLSPNVPDHRLCCRTYTCSWLPAFLYWNMQYHIEHHMYPAVPFFNLPKLRAAIEHDLPPAPHGLWATWKGMLEIHRDQLEDPDYAFVAELPKPAEGERRTRADDGVLEAEAALEMG
jgi:fatty acid desaturase